MTDAADLARALQRPWRHGEHLDARGTVLDAPLRLDGLTLSGVDLTGAHLKGGITARGATFQGLAWFRDARVDGPCDFTGARFRIDLRAEGMVADRIVLDEVQLRGVLALARVRARSISAFRALVMANLTLEEARVSDLLDLSGAEIMGGLWAQGARIGRIRADGTEIEGRVRNPGAVSGAQAHLALADQRL